MVVTERRVCGWRKMRPWANSDEEYWVRWYRVPEGTPVLPIPHSFHNTDELPFSHPRYKCGEQNPGEGNVVVGELTHPRKYDNGRLQAGFRPPTKFIGTAEQWLTGSVVGRHQPLVWKGGFSTACRDTKNPQGQACATGCPECPLVSPIWMVDGFEDFAGLTPAACVKTEGCEFSSKCVAGPEQPTPAAWEVIPEHNFGGLTGGVVFHRDGFNWSGCCAKVV